MIKKLLPVLCLTGVVAGILVLYGTLWKDHQESDINGNTKEPEQVESVEQEEHQEVIKEEKSLSQSIEAYLKEKQIPMDKISIYVKDLDGEEEYLWRTETYFAAASIYKIPLAMLYYDAIAQGEMQLQDTLLYEEYCYEWGGPIGETMSPGSYLTLELILQDMIRYSDNTAGHILFEHMGGWIAFKQACTKYSDMDYDDVFFSGDNVMNTQYVIDTLSYLWEHKENYQLMLTDMKEGLPTDFLNKKLPSITAQKYGSYGTSLHAAGIVDQNHPYAIVVFTELGYEKGRAFMGDINEVCYDYFNAK